MPIKVSKLTEMQKAHISAYVEEWTALGISSEPADVEETEQWIKAVYSHAGLKQPTFIWCTSPGDAVRQIIGYFEERPVVSPPPAFEFLQHYGIYATTWQKLCDVVDAEVWQLLEAKLRDVVQTSIRSRVWTPLWDGINATIESEDWFRAAAMMGFSITQIGCGQFNVDLFAMYSYLREVCNLMRETDAIMPWVRVAESCGWWIPCRDVCFVVDRCREINFDSVGRLHNEDAPALSYEDGFSIYSWHGVRVPEVVILEPGHITVELINDQRNAEIRRVMMERYGMREYIVDSGATILDESKFGILYRLDDIEREPLVMVCVQNRTPEADGTYRSYMLRVPPHTQTALEAVAWTFNMSPEEYRPLFET